MIAICFANFEFAILARSANTQKPLLVCRKIAYSSNCSNNEGID